jgi:long-subunit fatty acid transport protein
MKLFSVVQIVLTLAPLATGFQLLVRSASGLANAFAGSAVLSEEATINFTNPADSALLERRDQIALSSGDLVGPQIDRAR